MGEVPGILAANVAALIPGAYGNTGVAFMGYHVKEFESTPNPNAVKCWLDAAISTEARSFLNAAAAQEDPVAAALFASGQVTTVLFFGHWVTVNKTPEASWRSVKTHVKKVLASAGDAIE